MAIPHVVILGAGFGGVYVANALKSRVKSGEIRITVVNRTNSFLFTPLLHEVATGSLSPVGIAEPLRELFTGSGIETMVGEIGEIDPMKRTVRVGDRVMNFDYAVLATGATTAFHGVPGAEEHSLTLKTLHDAMAIRNRVIDLFEEGKPLTVAIVGGGATGVELAAEMIEFTEGMVKRYAANSVEVAVTLVHAGPELLAQFDPTLRRAAEERLRKLGVRVLMNTAVASVAADGITLGDGTVVTAGVVVWTAGVAPVVPQFIGSAPQLSRGRLLVDRNLRIPGNDRIFALGDAVTVGETALPMLAQVAVGEAEVVALNVMATLLGKPLQEFAYHSQGSLVSLGKWYAVGEILSAKFRGWFAWWLWRTIYLFKFVSWKKRIRIMFEWTVNLFMPRDITKF